MDLAVLGSAEPGRLVLHLLATPARAGRKASALLPVYLEGRKLENQVLPQGGRRDRGTRLAHLLMGHYPGREKAGKRHLLQWLTACSEVKCIYLSSGKVPVD